MPSQIPPEALFELKVAFFHELGGEYLHARGHYDGLLKQPGDINALQALERFFHRFAGAAHAVEEPGLGYLCAIAETVAELAISRSLPAEKAIHPFTDAMAAISVILEQHGDGNGMRRMPARSIPQAVVQPTLGDERVLSKVLVIDDDPFSASMIDGCLRNAGFVSSYCCSPEEALKTLYSELPDLVILDVVMPGLDGFDLCKQIRSHPALQFTPVIFVTRKGDVEQRVRGLEVGGNDYVSKPFEPQELIARVRSHLLRLSALREMAVRDSLTRCYNHKYFKTRLEQEIARAARYGHPVSLIMLDVDHFKKVNDTHGHPAGDAVIAHVADLVTACVRSTDVVARYGGEEFAVLLVHAGKSETAIIAQRIRERIASHKFSVASSAGDLVAIPITVSIGITQYVASDDGATVLKRADTALYTAKDSGRNQVQSL